MSDTLTHNETNETGHQLSEVSGPFKTGYGKLMMWYFLLSDAFTFAGFLISYGALRFSSPSWPIPDFVFSTFPGWEGEHPLMFVTFMTFVLLFSSFTMVRAVQEGKQENQNGVTFWMLLTILGGLTFLGCQAWEWSNLIGDEHTSLTINPFGTHTEHGIYLEGDGVHIHEGDVFKPGEGYLLHKHGEDFSYLKYEVTEGAHKGEIKQLSQGPKAFGALFFGITGFHGFHVFSGVLFLVIILINVISGVYSERKNGYEMVEKIGLYWHFVDLVWVFVFLVFYLM